jgi:wobble nucleotide-excising tRNase
VIQKITKIKNLGIFSDYKWGADLEDFTRYNLIYGWNGSGKTTLSKLFTALEDGTLSKHPSLEYEIEADGTKWKNGQNFNEKVRVFNRDYVTSNVEKIDGSGPNPIFILGDENKKLVEQIERDETTVKERDGALKLLRTEKDSLEKQRGIIFTNVASHISENVSGESTRTYRKPNAETDYTALAGKTLLGDDDLGTNKATLAQQEKPAISALKSEGIQDTLDDITTASSKLLEEEVVSVVIDRLTQLQDVSEWVERGLELHGTHNSDTCEFCGQALPEDRIKALGDHFNDADKKLKTDIETQLTRLRTLYEDINKLEMPEKAGFYDEIQPAYQKSVEALDKVKTTLLTDITELGKIISDKKTKTTEKVLLTSAVNSAPYTDAIGEVNAVIEKHNQKTANFEKEKGAARIALKTHYLSDIVDNVESLDKDIKDKQAQIDTLTNGDTDDDDSLSLTDLQKRITENRAKVSSAHKACKQINDKLKAFLGRDELIFEVDGEGYVIKRHGEVADDLSEGERTAIAFVYFTVQLQDQNFDLKGGIVVIDDPISSLDSNSLFQAFSFLKDTVKDAQQVFILTHNFEFLRQVKNWFNHVKKKNVNGVKKQQRAFYMIGNKVNGSGRRAACISPLDRLLWQYESEYHYLFGLLHAFDADGSLESVYNFPNIGRKFLETFLAFKIPSSENLHEKVEHLTYDATKKTSILRFVETHSHAERSDGVLNFDMTLPSGGQAAIKELLAMVQAVDQTHYDTLLKAHNKTR